MKYLLTTLLLVTAIYAKTVTVYDYSNGTYNDYDVQNTGTTTTIYDYQSGSYSDYEVE